MTLEDYVAARNADHAQTAAIKAASGLGCALGSMFLVFSVFWLFIGIGWMGLGKATTFALVATGVYMGVATWTAWRGVDPLANLAPLTRADAARREVEDAVASAIGSGHEGVFRREGVAGFANLLVSGPASLIGAWTTWRRRLLLDPETLERCRDLLERAQHEKGAPVEDDPRAALALVHLGLARLEGNAAGRVVARATAKGKGLI